MLKKINKLKKQELNILNYKTIWISDLHLGTRGCRSDMILEFIKYTQ